jgi:uncharacterized membrane protein YeaQ/YmgE (transglycosylase-associated protein family)
MDVFYWVMIGVLVAFVAKVQIPTEDGENMAVLLAMGVVGAVASGMIVHTFIRTGFMSTGWVSHVAAFLGAIVLVLGLRVATKQHLA